MKTVLVLGGGPDAEREVSLNSSKAIADALRAGGQHKVEYRIIDRISAAELARLPGDVVFPALHGAFGEGGPLQDLMEAAGRPYIGCGPRAARLAMDKMATKLAASRSGIPTAESCVLNPKDDLTPFPAPFVVKPVHDGSSVGLHIVRAAGQWPGALKAVRDDIQYHLSPSLPAGATERIQRDAVTLAEAIGVRHLARVDFIIDGQGRHWLLEINTLPGFTSHSLVPMAAKSIGLEMPALCQRLVELALRDSAGSAKRAAHAAA